VLVVKFSGALRHLIDGESMVPEFWPGEGYLAGTHRRGAATFPSLGEGAVRQ
jgi:hypothetical protein